MFVPANLPTPSAAPNPARPSAAPVVVLGADAVLAALPATAVQLAHACLAAGYQSAVPVSWGEELIAHAYLEQLALRPPGPAICGSCPRVVERLQRTGTDLGRFLVRLASPPVATARYLRSLAGATRLHVTYVGGCAGADDPAVDAQLTPAEFLASLARRGIVPVEQPTVFDGVLPPDRRRHFSLPGGVPAPDALWESGGARRLVEIVGEDATTELAEHLLAGESVLLDLAPGLGCACSGAASGIAPRNARMVVASLEPPRAPSPVVDVQLATPLCVPAPAPPDAGAGGTCVSPAPPAAAAAPAALWPAPAPRPARPSATWPATPPPSVSPRPPAPLPGEPPPIVPARATPERLTPVRSTPVRSTPVRSTPVRSTPVHSTPVRPPSLTPAGGVSRRTPVSVSRLTTSGVPLARRNDGRLLPRAYMARSRSLSHLPAVPEPPAAPGPSGLPFDRQAPAAVATPPEGGHAVGAQCEPLAPGVAAAPSPQVDGWRVQLDDAIRVWRVRGYRTGVLERAKALPHRPDVEGLLATYAAATEHLHRLEATAAEVYPHVRGHALFRDPERVAAAEAFVGRLMGGE
jgi:hypothetical protein